MQNAVFSAPQGTGEAGGAGEVRLAITAAELLAEGVRQRRVEPTLARLRRAVEEDLALNSYPVLAGLAKQMQRFL